MSGEDVTATQRERGTSGGSVPVPVDTLLALREDYLNGECSIVGGWGTSEAIEGLLALIPPTEEIRDLLSEDVWKACVWLPGSNYVHGTIDGADRTRIIEAVLKALDTLRGPPMADACCRFHNENCVDVEEACCWACPTWVAALSDSSPPRDDDREPPKTALFGSDAREVGQ